MATAAIVVSAFPRLVPPAVVTFKRSPIGMPSTWASGSPPTLGPATRLAVAVPWLWSFWVAGLGPHWLAVHVWSWKRLVPAGAFGRGASSGLFGSKPRSTSATTALAPLRFIASSRFQACGKRACSSPYAASPLSIPVRVSGYGW